MTLGQAQNAIACICDGTATPEQVCQLNEAAFERGDDFLAQVGNAFAFPSGHVRELINVAVEAHFPSKEDEE